MNKWKQFLASIPLYRGMVFLLGAILVIPIVYILLRALSSGNSFQVLLSTRIPELLTNTLLLTFFVSIGAVMLGTLIAILVVKTDVYGKKFWEWLLLLPLSIPPYIGALSYIIFFGSESTFTKLTGVPIDVYSFPMVVFIFVGFMYPYVYLLVRGSLLRVHASFEEVGQLSGYASIHVFRKVTLPMVRPAILSGTLLVGLYVLSDFGAVTILRMPTFSQAIYYQMSSFNRSGAAVLSMLLFVLTIVFVYVKNSIDRNIRFDSSQTKGQIIKIYPLGKWKIPATLFLGSVFGFFSLLPLGVIGYWAIQGFQKVVWTERFLGFIWNSLSISLLSALLCLIFALAVVYSKWRTTGILARFVNQLSLLSFSIPGVIVALGVIMVFLNVFPFWYGTLLMLIVAYIIRFVPQSIQPLDASYALVSPMLEDAGKSLGSSNVNVMRRITIPLLMPGVMASISLVFVSVLKELPATLLLRPAGFDTLAVRVWIEASDGFYAAAAPSALLLILISMLPLRYFMQQRS